MGEKILVVSDSHGDRDILVKLLEKYKGHVSAMFHCGDSELEPDDELFNDFHVVIGNCDYDPRFAKKIIVKVGSETVLLTHGHLYGVNSGLNSLNLLAQENKATIALFGHTHLLGAEMNNGCLFLNPGSISFPRGKYSHIGGTYALIDVDAQKLHVQFYNRAFEPVPDLAVDYKRG
ncbi:metallophosphoesterase [Liquorilactobacillus mali]|uniref:Phosphoesterase n=1 Tax=Liquorilactobacillus mali KCTC 3596 = DSM 20444 TaxID=1046596 RepID=J0UTP7_9LACO|nr:metallophosphoesterase [Liquorilactobacillus mali]EJF00812.1 phosphodiesterase [Liquorilactobacillus mali KCTC 3596 = DSM 20444]KRN11606.1 phosphodiesterase [Liquorilactobacillus mali KCTC 3596 = DSM 20444]MDC7952296.1 metallophosphoesterase [Liquorilactobacillus mali]MDV7756851.1 YfcE family phosphodiesterase [Liquorilactobacillus mali]